VVEEVEAHIAVECGGGSAAITKIPDAITMPTFQQQQQREIKETVTSTHHIAKDTNQVARETHAKVTATKEIGEMRKKFFLALIKAVQIPGDGLTGGVKGGWWHLQGEAADAWRETFDDCSNKPQSLAGFIKTMVKKGVLVTRNAGTTVLYALPPKKDI
jgi:hypothetical protein